MYVFVYFFRWVENKKASDRLIEVWDNVRKMVAFWEGLPKSKRPSSKSYLTVKDSVGDPLFTAKLQLFSLVSNIVKAFLKKYQTDQLMIPLLYCDLKDPVIKLLDIIVEHKIIEKCKNGKQLMETDLAKEENRFSVNKIKMSFVVEGTINKLKQKDLVTITEINAFKEGAQLFIISMFAKLFEKC